MPAHLKPNRQLVDCFGKEVERIKAQKKKKKKKRVCRIWRSPATRFQFVHFFDSQLTASFSTGA